MTELEKLDEIINLIKEREIVSIGECHYFNRDFKRTLHKDFRCEMFAVYNSPVTKRESFLSGVMGLVTAMNNRIIELENELSR